MKELFLKMRDAIACGKDTVLCTIIASSGSAPRGSGAKMAVFADGSTCGTIGGGAVEHESIGLAQQALSDVYKRQRPWGWEARSTGRKSRNGAAAPPRLLQCPLRRVLKPASDHILS